VHASPNFEERRAGAKPTILLLHYTGVATCEKAIDWLSRPESKVSCHYVVNEAGTIWQMVAEDKRAWHAGVGSWQGDDDVNSTSIGIEIQNPGHGGGYPEFPEAQMQAVEALSKDIIARHGIKRERVLGHSDIAPGRKIDPGEKFDWERLAKAGVGHWVEPEPVGPLIAEISDKADWDRIVHAQSLLRSYGYGIEVTGENDKQSRTVVAAFQRHFRPARVHGLIDDSTVITLERLIQALGQPIGS
jgi:N-acetylmuramoyl-L-alanine amidase